MSKLSRWTAWCINCTDITPYILPDTLCSTAATLKVYISDRRFFTTYTYGYAMLHIEIRTIFSSNMILGNGNSQSDPCLNSSTSFVYTAQHHTKASTGNGLEKLEEEKLYKENSGPGKECKTYYENLAKQPEKRIRADARRSGSNFIFQSIGFLSIDKYILKQS